MGEVDARVHIFAAKHQEEVGWLVLHSTFLPPGKSRFSFYRRLSGPQGQYGHERIKKYLYASATQDQIWAIQHKKDKPS